MRNLEDTYEPLAPEDQPPYPVEASAWGKNSYYHFCKHLEQQKPVAICMMTINLVNEGKDPRPGYESCWEAVQRGRCPALAMKQEEIDAGQALYYEPRRKVKFRSTVRKVERPSAMSSMLSDEVRKTRQESLDAQMSGKPLPKKKPAPKKVVEEPIQMDMGKMLNDMVKEESKLTAPIELVRQSGESPLAFARRKIAANL